ncbi:MAG: HAMP domain-containing sensor histidine kinase [Acidimicrobiales bacterium]
MTAPEHRRRRRLRLRSVRARVTVIATASVLVVLVVTSVLLVTIQRRVLTDIVEESIEAGVVEVASSARTDGWRTPLTGFGDDDGVAQVVGGDGIVKASTANAVGLRPVAEPPRGQRTWRTLRNVPVDDSAYRVLSVRTAAADGEVVIHVGATLDDVAESTSLLARSLGFAVPLVTVLLGLLLWFMTGRTLRPVEAMRREVGAIGGADLDRRVPEPGTDDEVDRLARTMNAMLDRVEDASVRQQRFVADASHELRSPLTRMRSELEVDLAHPERADPLATHRSVLDEAVGLQRLVEDLLLLARGDASAAAGRLAPVDLDEMVARLARRARAGGLEVDQLAVEAVQVLGDDRQLERALANVVDNAVRHARHQITFTLALVRGLAELTIADDGPGLAADQRERVFERFTRVDEARGTKSGGSGLGLAIARDVLARHGGTIAFADHDPPGTRVVIRLPAAP